MVDLKLKLLGSRCRDCSRSEEHTSELQSQSNLVCRLLLEKKKNSVLPRGSRFPPTRPRRHRVRAVCPLPPSSKPELLPVGCCGVDVRALGGGGAAILCRCN